jgi:hypothetical protein
MAILLYKWFLLLSGISPLLTGTHPLYVSVTEINHNATDKTLEISCKLFTDDFEKALDSSTHKKTDLTTPVDKAEAGKLVAGYIKSHLTIQVDGKPVTLEFVGFEKEHDAVWSYFQVSKQAAAPKKIVLTNTILYELYDKQINLMHVSVAGNRKSTRLNFPDKQATVEF